MLAVFWGLGRTRLFGKKSVKGCCSAGASSNASDGAEVLSTAADSRRDTEPSAGADATA
jgi:hypothetical protein